MSAMADLQQDMDAPTSGMSLSGVTSGVVRKPLRLMVTGEGGTGKTSTVCGADSAIIIDVEDGSHQQRVDRFPKPATWDQVTGAINVLRNEEHTYKSLIVDSVDFCETMCQQAVCQRNNWQSIEQPGFGRGYIQVREAWKAEFLGNLEALQAEKGMNVLLVAHTQIQTVSNPDGSDYTAHKVKLNKHLSALVREWCDIVAYIGLEAIVDSSEKKAKGTRHRMYFQAGPTYDAKCRYQHMPHYLDMPDVPANNWSAFRERLIQAMEG